MSKPTNRSCDSPSPEASRLPFQNAKAMKFGKSLTLASTSYDHIPGSELSTDGIQHDDDLRLPCKSFASSSKSSRQRFFHQAAVAVLLSIWSGCLWVFVFHFPHTKNESPYWNVCPRNASYNMFTPTSVFGSFTLGQAKAIDVAWNIIVGRAAQALICIIFHNVLMDVSMRMMELTTVPIDLFTSFVFKPFHLASKVKIVNSLDDIKGWRITTAMIWIFISMVYIASIPAMNDAMTGYIPRYSTNATINGTATILDTNYAHYLRPDLDNLVASIDSSTMTCFPDGNYAWGFAEFWLMLSLCSVTVWTIGTYAIWLDAQHHSQLVRKGRKMGMNRAILDTAEAINESLGLDTNAYSEKELEKALKKHPGVMFSVEERVERGTEHIKLSYKKDEKLQLSWTKKYGA